MLPHWESFRPLYISPGTDSFTQAAGRAFLLVTLECLVNLFLTCPPILVILMAELPQKLPCIMGFLVFMASAILRIFRSASQALMLIRQSAAMSR